MMYLHMTVVLIVILVQANGQDDIIGCGGFVKNDINLDVTQIQVQLLSSQGAVKYSTEPAPNGYYMIPVYEKGDYRIKISPREGWNFEPKGAVVLDLEACERNEDLNFVFTGFHLSGKVISAGSEKGPSDVEVTLKSGEKVWQTTTIAGGGYTFGNVAAGRHTITASHNSYTFIKAEVSVEVGENSLVAKDSPIVHGYSLTGAITNEGQPVKGVHFIIQSLSNKAEVRGCTAGVPTTYNKGDNDLCYVTSDESGKFAFSSVPIGSYTLVPYHRGQKTVFDVKPKELNLNIGHDNVILQELFTVSGFSVSGQVKFSSQGGGVPSAKLSMNGRELTTTDSQGMYTLDGMTSGSYVLSVTAPSIYFDDVTVNISPSNPQLPIITPSKFDLCGKMMIDSGRYENVRITITDTKTGKSQSQVVDTDGTFCAKVPPALYKLEPVMSDSTKLTPASVEVTVVDSPVLSAVKFSQFKAVVSGKVTCLKDCGDLEIFLTSMSDSSQTKTQKVTTSGKSAAFVFQAVIPGEYSISVDKPMWCWKDDSLSVIIDDSDVGDITLQHEGYKMSVQSSHPVKLNYESSSTTKPKKAQGTGKAVAGVTGEASINKGVNNLCLPSLGSYKLTPISCHQFDEKTYTYNIDGSKEGDVLVIQAVKHAVKLSLTSEESVSDVTLTLSSGDSEIEKVQMPATSSQGGRYVAELDYQLDISVRELTASAISSKVLFKELTVTTTINPDGCPAAALQIVATKGLFVGGSVTPAISGVVVQLNNNANVVISTTETSKDGKYQFGPISPDATYHVTSNKAGYVLEKDSENPYNFNAYKLAEVAVRVVGDQGEKLPGVILSLSGGKYKSNNRTNEEGFFSFIGLSPGKHYLKAILKEYEFTPASIEVDVREGQREDVTVTGKRVAYSCVGNVVSIRGDAVPCSVMVYARGDSHGPCANTEESSQAERSGLFRIRGLKPGCSYNIELLVGSTESSPTTSYRVSPQSIDISMDKSDVDVGRFILMESSTLTETTVFLDTPSQYLSTLKVILTKEGSTTPVQTVTPVNSKVVFFNGVPQDKQRYRVYLETSLSRKLHDYSSNEVIFTAEQASKAISLQFNTQMRSDLEYEVKESSILALVIVIATTLAVFNKEKIMRLVYKQPYE